MIYSLINPPVFNKCEYTVCSGPGPGFKSADTVLAQIVYDAAPMICIPYTIFLLTSMRKAAVGAHLLLNAQRCDRKARKIKTTYLFQSFFIASRKKNKPNKAVLKAEIFGHC